MWNNWFFLDLDGGSSHAFPTDPLVANGFGFNLFSLITSFVDNSFHQSRYLHVSGSLALREAFNCMSKFAGALLVRFTSGSNFNASWKLPGSLSGPGPGNCKFLQVKKMSSSNHYPGGFCFNSLSKKDFITPIVFGKIISAIKHFFGEAKQRDSVPVLSLATVLVPPFDHLTDVRMNGSLDWMFCEIGLQGCFHDLNRSRHAVEPRTGIKFPTFLDCVLSGDSKQTSEILVGTGSRTMTVVRIKSLKVYAFGFYIRPSTLCKKLSRKYASIPTSELNKHNNLYEDLLREDIDMTLRLVVNCNGMKINTVKDAFEKSIRSRLLKVNPATDFDCLRAFGSYFIRDIPLPAGTIIDFQRTADGQLITKIGGNQIGAVHSKDLCRAFFDMYIGDLPVSEQTKQEIGRNVASIIRRCRA